MYNTLSKFIYIFAVSLFLISCSGEDMDDNQAEAFTSPIVTADVIYSDLIGKWNLTSMEVDTLVDLNNDNVGNTNLLQETDCFKDMSITFSDNEGVREFSSVNARMDFRAGDTNDQFACMQTNGGPDNGTWDIDGDGNLVLYMTIDGKTYTHTKILTYSGSTFALEVTKAESQVYVTSDPTGTAVEKVTVVSVEYSR